jgi:erythromycin esterase-like protein
MMNTLERLMDHFDSRSEGNAKAIVWAHNTHVGDYRATDMLRAQMVNIGGLARERYGVEKVALLGFGTYRGSVIASYAWDGPVQVMKIPPARPHSVESALHDVAHSEMMPNFYLIFDEASRAGPLAEVTGHRAVGVVYDPQRERWGNYVPSSLANRYDAFLFVDETQALEPLEVSYERREMPETFPVGQ